VPTNLREFIEFARILPAPHIYSVISRAQAIGEYLKRPVSQPACEDDTNG
jgi:hypothetical protein